MRDLKWKKVKEEHIVQDQWIDFRRCRYQFPNGEEFEPYYNYSRRSNSVIVARDENGDFICVQQLRITMHNASLQIDVKKCLI